MYVCCDGSKKKTPQSQPAGAMAMPLTGVWPGGTVMAVGEGR